MTTYTQHHDDTHTTHPPHIYNVSTHTRTQAPTQAYTVNKQILKGKTRALCV